MGWGDSLTKKDIITQKGGISMAIDGSEDMHRDQHHRPSEDEATDDNADPFEDLD